MRWLLDTNILLRFVHPEEPEYSLVRDAVRLLTERKDELCFASQSLVEFWNVCTRPRYARGGYELSLAETERRAQVIEQIFTLVPDLPAVHSEWRRLVVEHEVSGVQVHDARIAALMRVHRLPCLLTLNGRDFARFPGITVFHPNQIGSALEELP